MTSPQKEMQGASILFKVEQSLGPSEGADDCYAKRAEAYQELSNIAAMPKKGQPRVWRFHFGINSLKI
jgi:hypothetical protein